MSKIAVIVALLVVGCLVGIAAANTATYYASDIDFYPGYFQGNPIIYPSEYNISQALETNDGDSSYVSAGEIYDVLHGEVDIAPFEKINSVTLHIVGKNINDSYVYNTYYLSTDLGGTPEYTSSTYVDQSNIVYPAVNRSSNVSIDIWITAPSVRVTQIYLTVDYDPQVSAPIAGFVDYAFPTICSLHVPSFSDPASGCDFGLMSTSYPGISTYDWYVNELKIPDRGRESYNFYTSSPGTYNVSLYVENSIGSAWVNKTAYFTVLPYTNTTPHDSDWPQYMKDGAHNATSTYVGAPFSTSPTWDKDIKAIGSTSPIEANGRVYVLTGYTGAREPYDLTTINLTCLDESTGAIIWNKALPRTIHESSWSSPATDGTNVFVATDYQLFAINAVSGVESWNYTGGDPIIGSSPTIGGDNVFYGDLHNYYSLNRNTGALNWIFNNTKTSAYDWSNSYSSPTYDSADGSIYVTGGNAYPPTHQQPPGLSGQGYLYKVNSSGSEVWSVQSSSAFIDFIGSAALSGTNVYVAGFYPGQDSKLYAYNKNTGDPRLGRVFPTIESTGSTPLVVGEYVYTSGGIAGWSVPEVCKFFVSNGTLVDSNSDNGIGGWAMSPIYQNGSIFIGNESDTDLGSSSYMFELNATDLSTVATLSGGGMTGAISGGALYTIGSNGHLYRYGNPVHSDYPVDNNHAFSATPLSGTKPLDVQFTTLVPPYGYTYMWRFGDGDITNNTLSNPMHVYTKGGLFNVSFDSFETDNGLIIYHETRQYYINVSSDIIPIAISILSRHTLPVGWYTWYNDTSLNSPTSYNWSFGDGTNSSIANGSKTFYSRGVRNVSSCVSNSAGSNCSYNIVRVI
jgi:outer membrane protein assembly factor BamB